MNIQCVEDLATGSGGSSGWPREGFPSTSRNGFWVFHGPTTHLHANIMFLKDIMHDPSRAAPVLQGPLLVPSCSFTTLMVFHGREVLPGRGFDFTTRHMPLNVNDLTPPAGPFKVFTTQMVTSRLPFLGLSTGTGQPGGFPGRVGPGTGTGSKFSGPETRGYTAGL
ncbi:hypothetical protein C8R44DRAFT_743876 [Mycena epipterygia]|nr:hypothetical protein C8R44DRAFT_743876 [Mycena epipterygia]